jgi:hypothetical protein
MLRFSKTFLYSTSALVVAFNLYGSSAVLAMESDIDRGDAAAYPAAAQAAAAQPELALGAEDAALIQKFLQPFRDDAAERQKAVQELQEPLAEWSVAYAHMRALRDIPEDFIQVKCDILSQPNPSPHLSDLMSRTAEVVTDGSNHRHFFAIHQFRAAAQHLTDLRRNFNQTLQKMKHLSKKDLNVGSFLETRRECVRRLTIFGKAAEANLDPASMLPKVPGAHASAFLTQLTKGMEAEAEKMNTQINANSEFVEAQTKRFNEDEQGLGDLKLELLYIPQGNGAAAAAQQGAVSEDEYKQ